jgi:hypothetical protein
MDIERNAPFFWLDGHEIEDPLGVESMTVNLEWLYVDIQVLICFLQFLSVLELCTEDRTRLT